MAVYGYARVSTTGQTLATQKALLLAAGVERIFSEKVSGVAARRPELERAIDQLKAGDILVVTKLDRLARSTLDLLRIVNLIGREGAGFKSLGDPWADTTTAHGRLMLTVLSGIAEIERDLILQRTNEGRARDGRGHKVRPQAEADQASGARSLEARGRRRAAARDRAFLQRRSLDDQSAQGAARCRGLIDRGLGGGNTASKRASSRPARSASAPRSIASATCRNRIERSR